MQRRRQYIVLGAALASVDVSAEQNLEGKRGISTLLTLRPCFERAISARTRRLRKTASQLSTRNEEQCRKVSFR